jgi:hypothetical protein
MASKPKPNKTQNHRTSDSLVLAPEVVGNGSGADLAKVQTVTGRRVRDEKEVFVLDTPIPAAAPSQPVHEAEEDRDECEHCCGLFLSEAFDANDGYCPGCGLDGDGLAKSEAQQVLSEAEQLLAQVQDDDDYYLRVAKFDNFEKDGKTDSRAPKSFCENLKPVTLDYEEIVRQRYGPGTYNFAMYKRGHAGFLKNWNITIAVPVSSTERAAPAVAAIAPPVVSGLDEVQKSVGIIKEVWRIMAPTNRQNNPIDPQPTQALAPSDPLDALESAFNRVDAWKKRFGIADAAPVVGAGGERSWVTDVSTLLISTGLGEGIRQFATPIGQVLGHLLAEQIVAARRKAQEEALREAGAQQPAQQPAMPQTNPSPNGQAPAPSPQFVSQIPPPAMPLFESIVAAIRGGSQASVETSVNDVLIFIQSAEQFPGAKGAVLEFITTRVLAPTTFEVANWLVAQNPGWADLLTREHAPAWIQAFRDELRAALEAEAESEASITDADAANILETIATESEAGAVAAERSNEPESAA